MIREATPQEVQIRLESPDLADLLADDFDPSEMLWLTDGHNILGATEWACRTFEIHWLFRDTGRKAINAGIDFLRHLYEEHDARVVVGQTPAHKRAARWFSRQVGGRSNGLITTELGEVEVFSMTRQEFEAQHGFLEIETTLHQHGAEVRQ